MFVREFLLFVTGFVKALPQPTSKRWIWKTDESVKRIMAMAPRKMRMMSM